LIPLNGRSSGRTLLSISVYFANQCSQSTCTLVGALCFPLLGILLGVSIAWTHFSSPPSGNGCFLPQLQGKLDCEGPAKPGMSQCEARTDCPPGVVGVHVCIACLFESMRSSCPEDIISMILPRTLRVLLPKSSINRCLRINGVPIIILYQLMFMTST
jgi:hypothetical protein